MDKKASPLKAKPLRQAGQSVDEKLEDLIYDKVLIYVIAAFFMLGITIMEWLQYISDSLPNPFVLSVVTVLFVAYCMYRVFRLLPQAKNLKLGRDGERAVGEFLERLREEGAIIFHDIVGDNFNLDHVILSSKGLYVIETKTYSKPKDGKVNYDGEHLNIDSIGRKDEIIRQSSAEAAWLRSMLNESTGKYYDIKPVILFPGWWVESEEEKIWVLEPKQLPGKLRSIPDVLSESDKRLAAYHLSRYIRAL